MKIYDLHTHSTLSDGDATVEFLVEKASEKGYILGVSDHIYCGFIDTDKQMKTYFDTLDRFDVLKGVEANIGMDFRLPDSVMYQLDYCIASVHSLPDRHGSIIRLSQYFGWRCGHRPDYVSPYQTSDSEFLLEESLRQIEKSFSTERVDIIGHSTVTPFYTDMDGTQIQLDFENELLSLCKKYNVALEISGLWKEPSERVVLEAKNRDIKFSFGSDCHWLKEVCDLEYVHKMIEKANIEEKNLFIPKKR